MSLFDFFRRRPIVISICIAHIPERDAMLQTLLDGIITQCVELYFLRIGVDTEILVTPPDEYHFTIGKKRNLLLQRATGDYVCFIDDDDAISSDYVHLLARAVLQRPDCCSLVGQITTDGEHPRPFIHSIKYNKYSTQGGVYFRPPNHLNCIKASIAKQFSFPEVNHSEDTAWALQISSAGLLKKEVDIPQTIYYYKYISNKPKPTHHA